MTTSTRASSALKVSAWQPLSPDCPPPRWDPTLGLWDNLRYIAQIRSEGAVSLFAWGGDWGVVVAGVVAGLPHSALHSAQLWCCFLTPLGAGSAANLKANLAQAHGERTLQG